jgi:hypothetical protein
MGKTYANFYMKIFLDNTVKFTSSVDKILHDYLLDIQQLYAKLIAGFRSTIVDIMKEYIT